MLSFEQFLHSAAKEGDAVNFMFEERPFGLVELVHKVAAMYEAEGIAYDLIGGMAVAAQIDRVDRDEVMLTRDVDIMIRRSDLGLVKEVAERHGFRFRHTAGLDMLMPGDEAKRGVRLIFGDIEPERIRLYGQDVSVVPVTDLVWMKLNAHRDKDRVHVRAMDSVGLITLDVERTLTAELSARLQHIRATE